MEGGYGGSQSDPSGDGVNEEATWQLTGSGGGGGGGGGGQGEMYPERPDEADCKYYLRTGFCGYGTRCRFNHPPDRTEAVGAMRLGGGEYPQRVGQPVCKYFTMTGTCKFGLSCKYHHPRHGGARVSLNHLGYPLRLGEKECAYYVKTGHCKFGVTCKFHHPQPADILVTAPSPALGISPAPVAGMYNPQVQPLTISDPQSYRVLPGGWQVDRPPTMLPYQYMEGTIFIPPGMVPIPGWAPFPAHVRPTLPIPQHTVGSNPLYGISQLSSSAAEYTGPYSSLSLSVGPSSSSSSQKDRGLPERPEQPECQYYMKTGDCKYGSSCRYHHPTDLNRPKITPEVANLPIRPGAPPCIYYAQYGVCKYGSACKYDHTSRASTLAAPSSSDLHQELAAVSIKDSIPTPISSSTSPTTPTSLISTKLSTTIGSKEASSSS